MNVKRRIRNVLMRGKRWLIDETRPPKIPEVPFDNNYEWLSASAQKLWYDASCPRRPHYIWGVLQGAALGRVLGADRISVIEFGVAGGAGLLALEEIADRCEKLADIRIDVYGFDSGRGLPKPHDYRDLPNLFAEGQFALDWEPLKRRLRRAQLHLGLVKDTLPDFIRSSPAPVAFAAFDLDLYTSTIDAFSVLDADNRVLLPRVASYFDDILGYTYCEYNGERLAIAEFNNRHAMKKICPMYGLKYFLPPEFRDWYSFECMYWIHLFDHPSYNAPDVLRMPQTLDIEGCER